MFSALVNDGEHVRLPSGRAGVVVGKEPGGRVVVLPFNAKDESDTVTIKAHLVQRVAGTSRPGERRAPRYAGIKVFE